MKKMKQLMKRAASIAAGLAMLAALIPAPALLAATAEDPVELVSNSTFDDGTTDGWGMFLAGGGAGSMSVTDGQLAIQIDGLGILNYGVQAYTDLIPLYENGIYRISFDISSTLDCKIEYMVQEEGGDYTCYYWRQTIATSEQKHISFDFPMTKPTDLYTKIAFNMGYEGVEQEAHTVYLDNVHLELIDDSAVDYTPYVTEEEDIIANQVGYYPDSQKTTVLRNVTDETTFDVVDAATDEVVYTGSIVSNPNKTASYEENWYGDFTAVTEPGTYYIKAGNLNASYPFTIGEEVYSDLLDDAVRMFYLQRCGCAVEDESINHTACHTELAAIYGTEETIDVTGGWHDAGDYGRYVVPGAKAAADLLLSYEKNPTLFSDESGIPESGNGIPDILDEVRYELEWMLKMQDPTTGGVHHKVSCADFPGYIKPDEETAPLIVTPVSTTATGDFAAVMAMAYENYLAMEPQFAEVCLAAAKNAYAFLENNQELIFANPVGINTGAYNDTDDTDERYWAAAQLYKATEEQAYQDDFLSYDICTGMGWASVGDYGNFAYVSMDANKTDAVKYQAISESLNRRAGELAAASSAQNYSISLSTYDWGSNMTVADNANLFVYADSIDKAAAYKTVAEDHLNYLLGVNPLAKSFVTGYGTDAPKNPHHRPSMAIGKAIKGMLVGGVNENFEDSVAKASLKGQPSAKCYIDNGESYSTNETTIYWNSPLVYLLTNIMTVETQRKETPVSHGTASFKYVSDWTEGCVCEITITNGGDHMDNWTLEFDFDREIQNIWSANIISHTGNHYVVSAPDWCKELKTGQSAVFGFTAGSGDAASVIENVVFS